MLSKSGARAFFVWGTALCTIAFIGMTVDTHLQLPERTNEAALTDEVVAGQHLWIANNCMGCHTLLGEGAYYAPELTKVVERRGAAWIRAFIKDPEAMFPGRRKMVKYDFTDEEISQLIAFFEWVGGIDTNGFPKDPPLQPQIVFAGGLDPDKAPGVFKSMCTACHQVGGQGGKVGPALDDVHKRFTVSALEDWIADPQKIKPGTTMPKMPITGDERAAIARYLMQSDH